VRHEIELYAAPLMQAVGVHRESFLSVQLVPFGGGSCGPRYERRLPTPDEMAQRVRQWLAERIGVPS
jgi:hypothetical protein